MTCMSHALSCQLSRESYGQSKPFPFDPPFGGLSRNEHAQRDFLQAVPLYTEISTDSIFATGKLNIRYLEK